MSTALLTPAAYFGSMNPRERKDWRRRQRAAGARLHLCRYCGFPGRVAGACPVCTDPPKEESK